MRIEQLKLNPVDDRIIMHASCSAFFTAVFNLFERQQAKELSSMALVDQAIYGAQ